MDFSKKYGSTDPKDSAEWFELDGGKFLIAPTDTIAFRNETLRTFKMGDIQADGLNDRTAYEIVELESGIKAKTVLLDWKDVKDGENEVSYSLAKAKDHLIKYDEFRAWVDTNSEELNNKKEKHKADAKKK